MEPRHLTLHKNTLAALGLVLFLITTKGCLVLNNPVTGLKTTLSLSSSSSSSSGCTVTATTAAVGALYTANGVNWMDHVQTAATTLACDGTVGTGGFESCIHGGERRRIDLVGIADCTGIAATDTLAAFDWSCNDNGGADAYVFSVTLKKGKGLRDILNVAGTAFEDNAVTVTQSGCTVVTTVPGVWWTNTITVLSDGNITDNTTVTLNGANSGTIFTVPADTVVDGLTITGNKIAIVTLGTAALRYSGMGYDNTADGYLDMFGNCGFGEACLISISQADFIWIEGLFRTEHTGSYTAAYAGVPATPSDARNVIAFFNESTYNTLRNITIRGAAPASVSSSVVGIYSDKNPGGGAWGLANSRLYNIVVYNMRHLSNLGSGFTFSESQYNIMEKLTASGNYMIGLEFVTRNIGNRIINAKVFGNRSTGISIDGNAGGPTYTEESTFINVLSVGNIIVSNLFNWVIYNSRRNTLGFISHGNYETSNANNSSFASRNGGLRSSKHTIFNQSLINVTAKGMYFDATDDTIMNTLAGSNVSGLLLDVNNNTNFALGGRVWYGDINGGGNACDSHGAGTNIVTDATCSYTGPTAPLLTNLNLIADVVGQTTDSTNAHGGTGNITYATLTDWISFDSFMNFFGVFGGTAGLAAEDRGSCTTGITCQIYSFELGVASVLKNINGTFTAGAACPASVDASVAANVLTDQLTVPNTFLLNAREVIDDYDSSGVRLGDDDGLCESNEACIFLPDIGASDLLEPNTSGGTCTYTGGNGVTGVTVYSGTSS